MEAGRAGRRLGSSPGERHGCWDGGDGSRGGDTGLDADSVLQVVEWSFLMDWLWEAGEKELVILVYYPSATYLQPTSALSRKSLGEGEPRISANSL